MRWQNTARWTCTAASALIIAAWACSLAWSAYWWRVTVNPYARRDSIGVSGGAIFVEWDLHYPKRNSASPHDWTFATFAVSKIQNSRWEHCWKPSREPHFGGTMAWLPLWILFLPVMIPSIMLWCARLRSSRRPAESCPKCAYDRRGLPTTTNCPECGTIPTN